MLEDIVATRGSARNICKREGFEISKWISRIALKTISRRDLMVIDLSLDTMEFMVLLSNS